MEHELLAPSVNCRHDARCAIFNAELAWSRWREHGRHPGHCHRQDSKSGHEYQAYDQRTSPVAALRSSGRVLSAVVPGRRGRVFHRCASIGALAQSKRAHPAVAKWRAAIDYFIRDQSVKLVKGLIQQRYFTGPRPGPHRAGLAGFANAPHRWLRAIQNDSGRPKDFSAAHQ